MIRMRTTNQRRSVWLLLGALLLAACQGVQSQRLPQSPLLARLERKSGLIVFVGLDGNIYTMNQAGENLVAITDDSTASTAETREYRYPTWAPDGEHIAYVGYHQTSGGSFESTLYVAKNDGSTVVDVHRSADSAPFYLYWGPNSERVSYLSSNLRQTGMDLRVAPVAGGEPITVETGSPFYWAWAPDGEAFVTHTGGSGVERPSAAKMALFSAAGAAYTHEELGYEPTYFQAPVYSPDGKYFVVAAEKLRGESALVLASPDGSILNTLVDIRAVAAFDWSPKGERLAYIDGQVTQLGGIMGPLAIMELKDVVAPTVNETDAENVIAFFWSPNGKQIAYFEPLTMETDSGDRIFLLDLSVLDVRRGVSTNIGALRPTASFFTQIVPFFDQYQRSSTIWSPDSRNIVINAMTADNQPGIYVASASGNIQPRFVKYGVFPFWSWK